MLIAGGSKGPLHSVHLRLGSIDTHFTYNIRPHYSCEDGSPIFNPESEAIIHFNDSREVDMMIDMLLRFKDANKVYFGEWRMVDNVYTERKT